MRTIVVIPAYNVEHTLAKTIHEIPAGAADHVLVVDDGSRDRTAQVAAGLGVELISHPRNLGLGAVMKTGLRAAMRQGCDVIVVVHGDNQYDPAFVPQFVAKIRDAGCDLVTGTRIAGGDAIKAGMPIWKYAANRLLTAIENAALNISLSDFHSGYHAYSAAWLRDVPLEAFSDFYHFTTDIIIEATIRKARIGEIYVPARYRAENSQMSFAVGVLYGLGILWSLVRHLYRRPGLADAAARIATGVLISVSLASSIGLAVDRILQWSSILETKQVRAEMDERFSALKDALPPRGPIGYISDEKDGHDYFVGLLRAQYLLAPLILVDRGAYSPVVGRFIRSRPARSWLSARKLRMVRDFGGGVMLFERSRR